MDLLLLDTLAQKGTTNSDNKYSEFIELQGEGTCKASFRKWPLRKYKTQQLCLALLDIAKEEGNTKWQQRYWNTWHCQNELTVYRQQKVN